MACSSHTNRPSERVACGALLLAAFLAVPACGKKGSPPPTNEPASAGPAAPAGPDLSNPEATFACASRAVSEGDFEALRACSTLEGIERVRRDLLAWNAILTDATAGPRALSRIPSPRDDVEKALYRAGFSGDPAGLLHMLVRTRPSDAGPVARVGIAMPAAGVERIETDRVLADGTRRRVVLVLRDGAWKVDRLAL